VLKGGGVTVHLMHLQEYNPAARKNTISIVAIFLEQKKFSIKKDLIF
jgi:hypothetical protein